MSEELNSADLEEPVTDNPPEAAEATADVASAAESVEDAGAPAVATEEQPASEDRGGDGAQSQGGAKVEKIRAAMQSGSSDRM